MSTAVLDFSREGISTFCLENIHRRLSPSDGLYIVEILTQPSSHNAKAYPINFPDSIDKLLQALVNDPM
jgi:hypothetical protein